MRSVASRGIGAEIGVGISGLVRLSVRSSPVNPFRF
jgi:hypothetical protein